MMEMLRCGSLVWIDTGSGVAAVSPSLRFGGVSPLIFLFFVSLLVLSGPAGPFCVGCNFRPL